MASAAVLAPLVLVCIWLGGAAWVAVVLAVTLGMSWEWVTLCRMPAGRWPGFGVMVVVVLAASVVAVLGVSDRAVVAGCLVLGAAAVVLAWAPGGRAAAGVGIVYLGPATLSLLWLRAEPGVGRADLAFLVLLVWASDIGAYAAGRSLGGPKLAPRISPGKTWSGAVGGMLVAAACGLGVAWGFDPALGAAGLARAAALAALLAVVSQVGDLGESAVKRRFGAKDSGRLIPGHGGLLDRLDGMLAAAPVAALLAWDAGQGVAVWR